MMPLKTTPSLTLAIPASFTYDIPHSREQTNRVGTIARAAATFRVENIIIYRDKPDEEQSREIEFVSTLLHYIETPQYLRKLLFPSDPILAYAGILPPLRTPHHPLEKRSSKLKLGEFREGVVTGKRRGGAEIEIGVERPAFLQQPLSRGSRVTVAITRIGHQGVRVRRVELSEIGVYWGFRVSYVNPTLGEAIGKSLFDLVVTTSRLGKPLTKGFEEIRERWRRSQNALIAFGSPREGLNKIMAKEGLDLDEVSDFVVNTIPQQGVKAVRTEEAVWATLAVFNVFV